jgi:branched-chain amino acid transport system substrate-binding protein
MRSTALLVACLLLPALGAARAEPPPALRIGVLTDMGGPYADAAGPGSVTAAELAVEDFGPFVLGRKIEIVSADHQNLPDVASGIAKQWYDRDGVEMITDLTNSAVAVAVQAVARARHRIDLVTSTATTALTNQECSPEGVHWTFDAYALATGTARALVARGGKTWFFITADYTFGANLEAVARRQIEAAGGTVLGDVRAPLNTSDYAAQLLQAQASGAQVIGLANSGADTAFYWDRTPESRAWSQRFYASRHAMPTMIQAGTYSAVLHYLRAVRTAGTSDSGAVMAAMRGTKVDDAIFHDGTIRADGQMVHDMYLVKVKSPAASTGPWDLYDIVRTIPGDEAFQPLAESTCKLLHDHPE